VFRFPRRRGVADDLPREWAALELAAPLFAQAGLRIPLAEKRGRPSEHFGPSTWRACWHQHGEPARERHLAWVRRAFAPT
jgi:hypothetical protein